jgi:hypothetical protein
MWRLISKPESVQVTRDLAETFAGMETIPHDRDLKERRLAVYRKLFQEGGFRPPSWATCYCEETDATYRVNGKHTSHLLAEMEAIPEFYVIIEKYTADTFEDVVKLYGTFDSRESSRNVSEVNHAYASAIPQIAEMPRQLVDLIVSGISWAKWQQRYATIPVADRAEQLFDNVPFASWLAGLMIKDGRVSKDVAHIRRSPVVAAMFTTFLKDNRLAGQFWTAVRDDSGESPDLPDRVLARFLFATSVKNGAGAQAVRKAEPKVFYSKCMTAWKAWRKGKTTNLKYYPNAKTNRKPKAS